MTTQKMLQNQRRRAFAKRHVSTTPRGRRARQRFATVEKKALAEWPALMQRQRELREEGEARCRALARQRDQFIFGTGRRSGS